jgi:hypothetical protein
MKPGPLRGLLHAFRAMLGFGVAGLATLAAAIAVAWSRYRACGPSSADAVDAACRLGAHLLVGAYALLSVSLVLGALSLTLLWRARRRRGA